MSSLIMVRSLLKLADLVALPFGNTLADARSVSIPSLKLCDSGYSSEVDQDKFQFSHRPKKDPGRITIRHEHMLYDGLALSVLGLIDKCLIVPVVMGMAGAALLIPLVRPTIGLERGLDLFAFRVQWKHELDVQHVVEYVDREVINYIDRETVEYVERDVIKYVDCDVIQYIDRDVVEVEKPIHHYIVKTEIIEKPVTRIDTIFVQTPTPVYIDAGVQANTMEDLANFTPKILITQDLLVPPVEQKTDGQIEKKNRKHRAGKKLNARPKA